MSKRILAVDDSPTLRKMVSITLNAAGHEVIEAADGAQALNTLAQLDGPPVDLIITDLHMPNMDGIALTRALRARPEFKTTPILLLTTESDAEKKQEGRAAGATGWIVKPFRQEQLLQVFAKLFPA